MDETPTRTFHDGKSQKDAVKETNSLCAEKQALKGKSWRMYVFLTKIVLSKRILNKRSLKCIYPRYRGGCRHLWNEGWAISISEAIGKELPDVVAGTGQGIYNVNWA